MVAPKPNEFILVPRAGKGRPTLDEMRRKLAAGAPESDAKPQRRKKRGPGKQSLLWTIAAACALVGVNVVAFSQKETLLQTLGVQTLSTPLGSPSGLSLDDRARFWAYAAYDIDKLQKRFKVPASALIDGEDARHHLEDLLTQPLGMSARAEILALKQPVKEASR